MNRLNTNINGGYPIELDDFRFLDEIYRNGIEQTIRALSSFAILTGCNFSQDINGDDKVEEGWLVINGEIGYLPETTGLDLDGSDYGVVPDNFFDTSVVKITQAGQSITPHEIRQFKLKPFEVLMGEQSKLRNLKPLKEVIKTEFGLLENQLKKSHLTVTPPGFVWNNTLNRWESTITHNLPLNEFNTIGVSVLIYSLSLGVLVPLIGGYGYENFSFSFDSTNLVITDNSPQSSNSASRSFLESNAIKVIFEYV